MPPAKDSAAAEVSFTPIPGPGPIPITGHYLLPIPAVPKARESPEHPVIFSPAAIPLWWIMDRRSKAIPAAASTGVHREMQAVAQQTAIPSATATMQVA